ncbi:hypothetical protein Tco_0900167, partial [Tanacetum coccineum]
GCRIHNTTLRNHITHPHCEAKKAQQNQNPEAGQTSMARDGSVFRYDPDYLREQFAGLVIQRALPFNHFDHEQTTRVFQNTMQPRYTHDHLDAKERKQDKNPLEIPLDFEEDVLDDEVQRNEAIPLSDEEIALDASSEGTLSPRGPRIGTALEKKLVRRVCHENNIHLIVVYAPQDNFGKSTLWNRLDVLIRGIHDLTLFLVTSMKSALNLKDRLIVF